jgi:hypothetical protein
MSVCWFDFSEDPMATWTRGWYYIKLGQVIARPPVTLLESVRTDWMQHVGYRTLLEASQADMRSFFARA